MCCYPRGQNQSQGTRSRPSPESQYDWILRHHYAQALWLHTYSSTLVTTRCHENLFIALCPGGLASFGVESAVHQNALGDFYYAVYQTQVAPQ